MDTHITKNKKRKQRTVFVEAEKWLKVSENGKTVDEEDYNAIKDIFDQLRNDGGKKQVRCSMDVGERNERIVSLMLCMCRDNIFDHVSKLSALKILNVTDYYQLDPIPSSLKLPKSLSFLTLRYCNLSHLPEEFGNLANLQKLNLYGNRGIQFLPTSIGNLKNLKELNLDRTSVQELPMELFNLSSLQRFHANTKEGIRIPSHIERLKNLEYLCSTIQGRLPREMDNMESLTELKLKNDEIPDSLKYAILCNRFKAVSRCSTGEKLWPRIISNAKSNSSAIHQLLTKVRESFVEMLINRSGRNVDVPGEAHIVVEH